jgi:hypothetical protein
MTVASATAFRFAALVQQLVMPNCLAGGMIPQLLAARLPMVLRQAPMVLRQAMQQAGWFPYLPVHPCHHCCSSDLSPVQQQSTHQQDLSPVQQHSTH